MYNFSYRGKVFNNLFNILTLKKYKNTLCFILTQCTNFVLIYSISVFKFVSVKTKNVQILTVNLTSFSNSVMYVKINDSRFITKKIWHNVKALFNMFIFYCFQIWRMLRVFGFSLGRDNVAKLQLFEKSRFP